LNRIATTSKAVHKRKLNRLQMYQLTRFCVMDTGFVLDNVSRVKVYRV